jgi:hypothetical protein
MITTVHNLVDGPYAPGQEARLKADVLAQWRKRPSMTTHFQIETEETEPGFPDVLSVRARDYWLTEFKVSDRNGVITFQKSQPRFYKKHTGLAMAILAWDVPEDRLARITTDEIVTAANPLAFKLPKGEKE